jgi:hypothetical protein
VIIEPDAKRQELNEPLAIENAIAAIENVSRVMATVHITWSLLCGEEKRQNAPGEGVGDYARNLGTSVSDTCAG